MLASFEGRRVCYDLVGADGAPLVVMAHCLSADMGVWSEQLPALLAEGWRVLRLDMRGHGGSDVAPGGHSMADLADDVVGMLDRLDLGEAHFVGVSIGGMIGQTLGVRHGERFRSLMLCGTSPKAVPGGQAMWDARFEAIAAAGSLEPIADATMARWFTDAFQARRPDRRAQIRGTVAATNPDGYRDGAQAIIDFDILADLPQVRLPTLVVCGDEDSGTPPHGNRRIAELIPGARYEEMPNARHVPMMEYPDAFNRLMTGWLSARR